MKFQLVRRRFLYAAGAGSIVLPGRSSRAEASERVRVAVIGLRNRGTDLVRLFAGNPGAQVAAVCDVDDAMFVKPVEAVQAITNTSPRPRKTFGGCSTTRRLTRSRSQRLTIGTPCSRSWLVRRQGCVRRKAGQS